MKRRAKSEFWEPYRQSHFHHLEQSHQTLWNNYETKVSLYDNFYCRPYCAARHDV